MGIFVHGSSPAGFVVIIELITIGNELLSGRRVDTNTLWIGQQIKQAGHSLKYRQTVNDTLEDIRDAFLLASRRSDLVISTGGLGPTQDDITFEALALAASVQLHYHPAVEEEIKQKILKRNIAYVSSNRRQACLPQGSCVIANHKGTAPGCRMKLGSAEVFVFPGVPLEMQSMFERSVLSAIDTGKKRYRFDFSFFGLPEAAIEEKILHDLAKHNINIAYSVTASFPLITFEFFMDSEDENQPSEIENQLQSIFFLQYSQYLWRFSQKNIEQHVILTLKEKGWKLQTAESISGGMLSAKLIDVAGCSQVLQQGLVTYSNESKMNLLGVLPQTLRDYGAVSSQCGVEMAQGLLHKYGADVAVATTGIAGPEGGTPEKPVGLVFIAWVGPGFSEVKEFRLSQDRAKNRILTTHHALNGLYNLIKGL